MKELSLEERMELIKIIMECAEKANSNKVIEFFNQRSDSVQVDAIVMWRSVEDEMPDAFVGVLAADKRGRIYLVEFDGGNFIQTAEGEYAYDITHWAPLPEPPQAT